MDLNYYDEERDLSYDPSDWPVSPEENVITGQDALARRRELETADGKYDENLGDQYRAEYQCLHDLTGQAGHPDFVAVNAGYWDEYVMEEASNVAGDLDGWPFGFIDWVKASDALRTDYASIDFGGVEYYVR